MSKVYKGGDSLARGRPRKTFNDIGRDLEKWKVGKELAKDIHAWKAFIKTICIMYTRKVDVNPLVPGAH